MLEVPASIDSQTEDSTIYVKGHDACQRLHRGSQQRTLRDRSVSQTLRTSPRRQRASKSVLKPIPNEVYVAYWSMSKSWFAVLIVPFEDIEKFGLSESIPACYDYNEHTGQVDWKRGYEDGGPLAVYREFPVIFFEETRDFDKGTLGWVAAKDIRDFNDNGSQASLIPNYDLVRTFIRNRHVPPADHEIQNDPQSDSTFSSAGSATELSSERGLRSRRPTAQSKLCRTYSLILQPMLNMWSSLEAKLPKQQLLLSRCQLRSTSPSQPVFQGQVTRRLLIIYHL
ncbi:hypothetical protein FALCPG4_014835 [Fusarium falciforme]